MNQEKVIKQQVDLIYDMRARFQGKQEVGGNRYLLLINKGSA
jgi:hypothetical protein